MSVNGAAFRQVRVACETHTGHLSLSAGRPRSLAYAYDIRRVWRIKHRAPARTQVFLRGRRRQAARRRDQPGGTDVRRRRVQPDLDFCGERELQPVQPDR
eukprot:scaffold6317_cov174-Isochrysis_galbana.AAC.3